MQGLLDYEAGMPAGGGKCRYRITMMLNQGYCKCVCLCVCVCVRYMKPFFTLFQPYKKLQLDYTFTIVHALFVMP